MNGKKGSIEIDIQLTAKAKPIVEADNNKKKDWELKIWKFCKEDSNRIIFAFEVGLAVLLVSLLILFQAPYEIFGTNIIWSILTVAMFEYTVGATFNRGFNRAIGSLLAGVMAIVVAQLALHSGRIPEP